MAFPSPDLPCLTFYNMNVGPHKRKIMKGESRPENETVSAEERRKAIRSFFINEKPTVLFVQEFKWSGLHGSAFVKYEIPKHYKFCGNNESGFIYNEKYIHCERLDLKSSLRRSYGLLISHQSVDSYFELPRLSLCKIKSTGPPEFELLCACWHGPKNNLSCKKRKSHLRSLLRFLLIIKSECGNLPLLIGGDFNLKSCEVMDISEEISDELQLGENSGDIMLWIHCGGFSKKFEVQGGMISSKEAAFDHPVLTMEVKVTTTVEDFKRHVGQQRYPNEIVRKTNHFEYCLHINAHEGFEHPQMISASWHGAYDEYSDGAKEDSFRGTLAFLLREIQSHLAKDAKNFHGYVQLDFEGVSKDETVMENIHSRRNTLDTWIMRINNPFISKVYHGIQSLFESDNNIIYLPPMSTPHQCPGVTFQGKVRSFYDCPYYFPQHYCPQHHCLPQDCPPQDYDPHDCPPHYCSPQLSSPDERHVENATPVDIHMEVVNMVLPCSGQYACTVNGYLKKCIYLQSNSPE